MTHDVLGTQRAIRDDKTLSTTEKALLFAATLRADRNSCKVRASIEMVAADMDCSRRTASRVFAEGNENVMKYFARVERSKRVVDLWFHESPVCPSEELVVPEVQVVIPVPENPTVGQDDTILKPAKAVFAAPEPTEDDCELTGHAKTIISQSKNPELAEIYYRDVEFAPGKEDVVRAAMARTDADYDEHYFVTSYEGFDDESLVEYILRMKRDELINA